MIFKIQYKILIIITIIISFLIFFTFFRMNTAIEGNFVKYITNRIRKIKTIAEKYIINLQRIKRQNIRAFANIAELNKALDEKLEFQYPFILRKYLRDYQFHSLHLYNSGGKIIGEAGMRIPYQGRHLIRYIQRYGSFSGIFKHWGRLIFLAGGKTATKNAVVISATVFSSHTAYLIRETLNASVVILRNGKILVQSLKKEFPKSMLERIKKLSTRFTGKKGKRAKNALFKKKEKVRDKVKQKPQNEMLITDDKNGYMILLSPLKDHLKRDMAVIALGLSTQFFIKTRTASENILVTVVVSGAALALLLAILFSRGITNAVKKITIRAEKISAGDLDYSVSIRTHDEIHTLARAFDIMVANLKKSFDKIRSQNIELRKLDQMKSELIANVSHELQTPITTIAGYIEMLVSGDVNDAETLNEFYNLMDFDVKRLKKIVKNFIMISFVDKEQYHLKDINLFDFFTHFKKRYINNELKPLVKERGVKIRFNVLKQVGRKRKVKSDEEYMNHIFYELLHNAISYSPRGLVEFDCSIDGNSVVFMVKDSGVGIPNEHREKIFENFYKVENAGTALSPGIGLGLSTVKMICDILKYDIVLESVENEYTLVSIKGFKLI